MNKTVVKALTMLENAGFEAYMVGGCVRDILLGTAPHDFDITTSALPEQTKAVFSDYNVIETGIKHGTVTVLINSLPLEITTFRSDGIYADGRHPVGVTFVSSLKDDLARRDFTVCAMAMDKKGQLYDYFGGQADLQNRLIRCVGDPGLRFAEDALRLLRALRFASTLGFKIESNTDKALTDNTALIKKVSAERISEELFKTLCGNFTDIFLKHTHLLSQIIPEIADMAVCAQRNVHHKYNVWEHSVRAAQAAPFDPVLRFALLLHDSGKPKTLTEGDDGQHHFYGHAAASTDIAARVCRDLKLSNENAKRVVTLVKYHDYPLDNNIRLLKRRLAKFGESTIFDLLSVKRADNFAQSERFDRSAEYDELENLIKHILSERPCLSRASLAVNGSDIMSLGVTGKEIGCVLDKLLASVIDDNLKNDRDALINEAVKIIKRK